MYCSCRWQSLEHGELGDTPAEDFRDRQRLEVEIELGTVCEYIGQGDIARLRVGVDIGDRGEAEGV